MNSKEKAFIAKIMKVNGTHLTEETATKSFKLLKKRMSKGEIYANVRSVSRSGMSRVIDFYMVDENKTLQNIALTPIGHALEGYNRKLQGYKAGGCGMDMIFATLYSWWHDIGCPHKKGWKPDACQNAPYNSFVKYRSM